MFGGFFKPKDLWAAAKSGNVKVIEELVAAGHDVNAKRIGFIGDGDTPLDFAVRKKQKEAIKTLVRLGARINGKNKEGFTPLMTAICELKEIEIAELLLDLGAKIDMQGDLGTALDIAASNGDQRHVKLLLKRGAKPNAGHGKKRASPVGSCADGGHVEVLKMLISAGADVNAPGWGWQPISSAAINRQKEFVRALIEAKADVNMRNDSGFTPLMAAVRGRDMDIVKMLINAGANVNAVQFSGRPETALDLAEENKKSLAIADYLRGVGGKCASELPASETTPPPQKENGTFWQLRDDSSLEVTLDPWPARPGQTKLKVEISPNGHDPNISFSGTLEYRVAASEDNSEPWKPIKRGQKNEENNVRFSESVALTRGTIFVQFKVHPEWEKEATVLKDWKIEVS